MNAQDVIKYGHGTVIEAIDGLPESDWQTTGVCGVWSVKNIIAHLASFELVLVDVLNSLLNEAPTPMLDKFIAAYEQFNDIEVEARRHQSVDETLAEYCNAYTQAEKLLAQVPVEQRRQNGLLAWYGQEYDLEDFITYAFYGHKREHCAQIGVHRDRIGR